MPYGKPLRWVWCGAILATMVLPALLPRFAEPATVAAAVSNASPTDQTLVPMLQGVTRVSAAAYRALAAVQTLPLALWAGVSLMLLGVLAWSHRRLHRERRTWAVHTIAGAHVFISRRLGPAVVGFLKRVIVLPEWTTRLDDRERRMIVAHEQEHVRAGDSWLIHAACLAVAAMPWNAALWWQLRRLRMAVETDCDRRVLAGGVDLGAYGTMLIDMQSRVVKPSFAAVSLAGNESKLKWRIAQMTSRAPRGRWARSAALTIGAIAIFSLACEMPTPVAVDDEPQVMQAVEIQWAEYAVEPLKVFVQLRAAGELAAWVYVDQSELQGQVRRVGLTEVSTVRKKVDANPLQI